jgi:hypothetical protein
MKRPTLNARDRRALLLGAAVVVPSLLYVGAVAPAWRAMYAQREELAQSREALRREQALVARVPAMTKRQTELRQWLAHEMGRLFQGSDDIAATSGLADAVTQAADRSGVQIRQTETRPAIPVTGTLHAVRLNVRIDGSTRELMTFLQLLEDGDHLIRVGQLTVGPSGAAAALQRGKALAPDGSVPGILVASAELYGYAMLPMPSALRNDVSDQEGAAYHPLGKAAVESVDISDAIEHDPFSADRGTSHTTRVASMPSAPPPPPPFPVRLVGTAVDRDGGGFAVCQLGDLPAVVVHRGERIAGYTLRSIERGAITLVGAGGTLVHLSIPTPEA